MCHIQFAGYTCCVYVVPGVCNCYLESNSVLLAVANDYITSAVLPTRRGAHEKTYGIRNRRRNVYASLEVWMLWLGCLTKHNKRPRSLCVVNLGIHTPHPLDLRGAIIKPSKPPILLNFKLLKHLGPCLQRSLSSLK